MSTVTLATPLALRAVPLHSTLAAGGTTTEHVLVRATAVRERTGPRPRLATVLVIDVSGSMRGEPLAQVIRSAQTLAEILPDGDSLGIVAFDSQARTVVPLRRLDAGSRREIQHAVAGLVAGSNTNASAGLSRAALLLPAREANERQLLLLLTDGQVNEGVTTKDGLAAEVAVIRAREVAVSTLGYGAAHNEDVLDAIATAGGGRYAFVSDPLLARSSFVRALGSQLDVVAEGVRLVVSPDPGVEIVRVLGNPPTSFGAQGLTVKLQDLIVAETASLVLELRVAAPPHPGPFHLVELTLEGKSVGTGEPFVVGALATVTLGEARSAPDPEAAAVVAIGQADELRTAARAFGDRRDFAGAIVVLRKAIALLEGAPVLASTPSGKAVRDAVEALRDDVSAYERVPTAAQLDVYKKGQRHTFDFASGSKPQSNQVAFTEGTALLSERMNQGIPHACLLVADSDVASLRGSVFPLGGEATIGRSPDLEVALDGAASVSRQHARVVYEAGAFWLFDLGSSNATLVNGQTVTRHRLADGDRVRVGRIELVFKCTKP